MIKSFILTTIIGLTATGILQAEKYVGGDISELPIMEGAKAQYKDKDGKLISDLISYSREQGMNAMRVRLFVDPDSFIEENSGDPYACQSYDFILPLCKRIKEEGLNLLLDFHYSDTWADPAKQYTPAAWASLNDEDLYTQIYDYTKEVLENLKQEGVTPDFIQTGNEISYGMCWAPYGSSNVKKVYFNNAIEGTNATNINRFGKLLANAIKACREVCPEAKIVLHSERTPQPGVLTNFYDWAAELDYDIIGLSYYFYYHGKLSALEDALYALEARNYGKDIWIVETGAALNWSVGDSDKQFYDVTDEGQNLFATELLTTLDKHPAVNGLFWWEMDYNAYPYSTTKLENWYNASLFDNNTGKASSAFYTIANWANTEVGDENTPDVFPDYYLLYNQGGDWAVPGTKFNNNEDGTYTLEDVEIYQTGSDYAWFAITSVDSTNWDVINAYRFGPEDNNEDPLEVENCFVAQNSNSWQIEGGVYNLYFDALEMILKVRPAGEQEGNENEGDQDNNGDSDNNNGNDNGNTDEDATGIGSLTQEFNVIYFDLQGNRVTNPQKGLFIRIEDGKTSKILVK